MSYIQSTGLDSKSTILTRSNHPLDVRAAVDKVSDLYKASTWIDEDGKSYIYNGMVVSIKVPSGIPELYILQNYVPGDNFSPMNTDNPQGDTWLASTGTKSYWRRVLTNEHTISNVETFKAKYGWAVVNGTLYDADQTEPRYYTKDHDSSVYTSIVSVLSMTTSDVPETLIWAEETVYQKITVTDLDGNVYYLYCDMSLAQTHKTFTLSVSNEDTLESDIITKFDGSQEESVNITGEGSVRVNPSNLSNTINIGIGWKKLMQSPATVNITYNIGRTTIADGYTIADACSKFGSCTYSENTGYTFKNFFTKETSSSVSYDKYATDASYTTDVDVYRIVYPATSTMSSGVGLGTLTLTSGSYISNPDEQIYKIAAYLYYYDGNKEEFIGHSNNFITIDQTTTHGGEAVTFDFSHSDGSTTTGYVMTKQYCVKFLKFIDDDTMVTTSVPSPSDPEFQNGTWTNIRISCSPESTDNVYICLDEVDAKLNYTPVSILYKLLPNFSGGSGEGVFSCAEIPMLYTKIFNLETGVMSAMYWNFQVDVTTGGDTKTIVSKNTKCCGVVEGSDVSEKSYIYLQSGKIYNITMTLVYNYKTVLPVTLPEVLS